MPAFPSHSPWRANAAVALLGAAVFGLLLVLYGFGGNTEDVDFRSRSAILWMVERWSGSGGDLSHGWMIPLVSGYLVWRAWSRLRAAAGAPDWRGLAVMAGAMLIYVMGVRIQQTRLVLLSLVVLAWATPLLLWGAGVARQLVFPCGYLLFCIPLSFLDTLTFPLRLIASRAATVLLNGIGIAAQNRGTAIFSTAGGGFNLEVADPCSGLRSILAMAAVSALYAFLSQRTLVRQWLLFLTCIPIAVCGNIVRILSVAIMAHVAGQDQAVSYYHDYSSFVFFVTAILLMMGVGALLDRLDAGRSAAS